MISVLILNPYIKQTLSPFFQGIHNFKIEKIKRFGNLYYPYLLSQGTFFLQRNVFFFKYQNFFIFLFCLHLQKSTK